MSGILIAATKRGNSVSLTDHSVSANDYVFFPDDGDAIAGFIFNNTGVLESRRQTSVGGNIETAIAGEWLKAGGVASDHEMMVTLVSGSAYNTTLNTWLALSTNRGINNRSVRSVLGITSSSAVMTVQVRKTGTTAILGEATFTMSTSATVETNE